MWKVSWFYEKVHNIANFGGYATILIEQSPIYSELIFTCVSYLYISITINNNSNNKTDHMNNFIGGNDVEC